MLGFFFRHTTAALRAAEILAKFLPYGAVQWKRPAAGCVVLGVQLGHLLHAAQLLPSRWSKSTGGALVRSVVVLN